MMEAATHFVEVVPEDMQTLGTEEEMLPPVSASVVSSSSIINMNTLIYSQGPDGIIMEGDEIGPDIVGEIVTDDSPDMKVLPTNQVIHMDLAREKHQRPDSKHWRSQHALLDCVDDDNGFVEERHLLDRERSARLLMFATRRR
ncbi:hypothetical protein HPB50_000691 [Hyalomma asiaticum]|uniref:Uncharacterized protein n=1 Tax=Hyalomma asiaticum TaxID=266040 RepID=A0ACB7SJK2_HYAAI|nr:hypothetical protein HPB50_000691 [Hyalomma asiaticum]